MIVSEPAVTMTDFGLAAECALFACLVVFRNKPVNPLGIWFAIFFASSGLSALAGGAVHGFFPLEGTPAYEVVWRVTLTAIGSTALAAWVIGSRILFSDRISRRVRAAATAEFLGYCIVVWFYSQEFRIAIANYLPPVVFLLGAFIYSYRRTRDRRAAFGSMGLLLTLGASWVQQHGIAVHPVYFNHNAFYHLIQAVALFLIFLAAGRLVSTAGSGELGPVIVIRDGGK